MGIVFRSCAYASMGPRSENRGHPRARRQSMAAPGRASMGPRSENRGYHHVFTGALAAVVQLQWVHGLRTVVIKEAAMFSVLAECASMGPRSENRGYPPPRRSG